MLHQDVSDGGEIATNELSEKNLRHLELEFFFNEYPNDQTKTALAQLTGLTTHGVNEWFERKRRRALPPPVAIQSLLHPSESAEHAIGRAGSPPDASPPEKSNTDLMPSTSREHFSDLSSGKKRSALSPNTYLSIVDSSIDNNSSEAVLSAEIKRSQVGKLSWPSTDGKRDRTDSSLPGFTVFPVSGDERILPRRRRVFNDERRRQVASVRRIGACSDCRSRKMRCLHAIEKLAPEEPAISLSSPSPIPASRALELYVNTRENHELTALGAPSNRAQSADLIEECTVALGNVIQHSSEKKSTSTTQATSTEVCNKCGFRPDGDPKWHKSNLARHMRVRHSGTTPVLRCSIPGCAHTYTRSDNLRAHMRKAHS